MSGIAHHQLELRAGSWFTNCCEIVRDGCTLASTTKLFSPLHTDFVLDGRTWRIRTHIPGGRGVDLLRELVLGGLLNRTIFGLSNGESPPVATARQRGFFKGGYDLLLSGERAGLDTDKKVTRYDYTGPGGRGLCEPLAGHRGMIATLPATLPAEHQIFIALLALRAWIRFSDSS